MRVIGRECWEVSVTNWECTKCGACCMVGGLVIKAYDRGDGVCCYLGNNMLCGVYKNRPQVCRTSENPSTDEEKHIACEYIRSVLFQEEPREGAGEFAEEEEELEDDMSGV